MPLLDTKFPHRNSWLPRDATLTFCLEPPCGGHLFCFVFCLSFLSYSFIEIFPEKIIKNYPFFFFYVQRLMTLKWHCSKAGHGANRSALRDPFSKHRPHSQQWTLDLCLHGPLLIPKINSSAHLCPQNTTLTPTAGGILTEKMSLAGIMVKHQFDLSTSDPLSAIFPPSNPDCSLTLFSGLKESKVKD